jgi:PAS domain S-box-containing protein
MPVRVQLESLPVRLFLAADEQWEAMLREYALRGMGGTTQSFSSDEITQAGGALAIVQEEVARLGPDSGDQPAHHRTITLDVPTVGDFGLLQAILEDGWQLARAGHLLAFPSVPEVVALRNWLCEEVTHQAAGAAPTAWRFEVVDDATYGVARPRWDPAIEPAADTAWLIGDDHNRIVAASPAALALLGWTDELVGQRLLSVIPPEFREQHIAGFTRSVVTGGGDLLGQPLSVPALARDGEEIPISLLLTRHPARNGRSVYVARLDRAPKE